MSGILTATRAGARSSRQMAVATSECRAGRTAGLPLQRRDDGQAIGRSAVLRGSPVRAHREVHMKGLATFVYPLVALGVAALVPGPSRAAPFTPLPWQTRI